MSTLRVRTTFATTVGGMDAPIWTLGDVVRKLRQQEGWTQQVLAAKAGVNAISVVRLERASEKSERSTITRVAKALRVDEAELYAVVKEVNLLSELTAPERQHVLDYVRRVIAKRQVLNPEPSALLGVDPADQAHESRAPVQKRQRR